MFWILFIHINRLTACVSCKDDCWWRLVLFVVKWIWRGNSAGVVSNSARQGLIELDGTTRLFSLKFSEAYQSWTILQAWADPLEIEVIVVRHSAVSGRYMELDLLTLGWLDFCQELMSSELPSCSANSRLGWWVDEFGGFLNSGKALWNDSHELKTWRRVAWF